MFGKRFEIDDPVYYGYLTLEEAKKLENALSAFELPDVDSDEWDDLPLENLEQLDCVALGEFLESLRFDSLSKTNLTSGSQLRETP